MHRATSLQPLIAMPRATVVACGLLLACSQTLHAQSPSASTETDDVTLGEVVVTATGFEQQIEDAPASISIIKGEELRKRAYRDLTDALRDVEGVVVNGGANEADISIRGMGGSYTLILVDGKRQGSRDARVNGSGGFEQSFIPPVEAIERIEAVSYTHLTLPTKA